MTEDDPLAVLDAMARKLMRRTPDRWTWDEIGRMTDALARLVRERALSPDDLSLVMDCLHVPATVLNLAIVEKPELVDAFTEEQLLGVVRVCTPTVRAIVQRRLDTLRGQRRVQ